MYPHLQGSFQPRFNLICQSVSRALVRKAANREIQLSSHTPHRTRPRAPFQQFLAINSCRAEKNMLHFRSPFFFFVSHDPFAPTHDCRFITDFLLVLFELCLFFITTTRRVGWKKCFECCFFPHQLEIKRSRTVLNLNVMIRKRE